RSRRCLLEWPKRGAAPWAAAGPRPAFSVCLRRFERLGQMPAEGRQQPTGPPHVSPLVTASNDNAVAAEYPTCRGEGRDLLRLQGWRVVSPKILKTPLFSGAIVVPQVGHIARCVVGKPLIDAGDADPVQHAETVACCLPLV